MTEKGTFALCLLSNFWGPYPFLLARSCLRSSRSMSFAIWSLSADCCQRTVRDDFGNNRQEGRKEERMEECLRSSYLGFSPICWLLRLLLRRLCGPPRGSADAAVVVRKRLVVKGLLRRLRPRRMGMREAPPEDGLLLLGMGMVARPVVYGDGTERSMMHYDTRRRMLPPMCLES